MTSPRHDHKEIGRGYLLALAASVLAGLFPTVSKLLLASVAPIAISGLIYFFSALILLPYHPKQLPSKKSFVLPLVTGLLGAAAAPVIYLYGVRQTTVVNAALLANGEVFFTAMFAFLVFGERIKRKQLFEGLLIVAGIIVVTTNLQLGGAELLQGVTGNLLILAAAFIWGIDNNLSRIASQRLGAVFSAKFKNLFGGGFLLGILLLSSSASLVVPHDALPLIVFMTASLAVSSLLFMGALARIGAVRTVLVFSLQAPFGSIFGVVILHESITVIQIVGGALILLGVYLIQRSEGPPNSEESSSTSVTIDEASFPSPLEKRAGEDKALKDYGAIDQGSPAPVLTRGEAN
jgi:drug/metabolite transporter (DMT)-like permease